MQEILMNVLNTILAVSTALKRLADIFEKINIDAVAEFAQVIIAAGAVITAIIALRSLSQQRWSNLLGISPSVAVQFTGIDAWCSNERDGGGSGLSKGDLVERGTSPYIYLSLDLDIINVGGGAAFNIGKPMLSGPGATLDYFSTLPTHLMVHDNVERRLKVGMGFDEWYALTTKDEAVYASFTVAYTDGTGSVNCKSHWQAKIKPFCLLPTEEASGLGEKSLKMRDDLLIYDIASRVYHFPA